MVQNLKLIYNHICDLKLILNKLFIISETILSAAERVVVTVVSYQASLVYLDWRETQYCK